MPITSFPPAPSRANPNTFADLADAYLGHLENPFVAEANALEANVNAKEASANLAATNALASANAAANTANVTAWVSGAFYNAGESAWDTTNFLTYRRKVSGANVVRPELDTTNWVLVSGQGNVTTDTNQTITGLKTFSQPIVGSGASLTNLDASSLSSGTVPAAQLPLASESVVGAVEFADATEANGVASDKAISPARMRDALNAPGTAPIFACRAWVNFNGVPLNGTYSQVGTTITVTMTSHGMETGQIANLNFTTGTAVDGSFPVTVTGANTFTMTAAVGVTTSGNVTRQAYIRASGNVSSITDNGIGDYTVNFITPMNDANYVVIGSAQETTATGSSLRSFSVDTVSNTGARVFCWFSNSNFDVEGVHVAIFR